MTSPVLDRVAEELACHGHHGSQRLSPAFGSCFCPRSSVLLGPACRRSRPGPPSTRLLRACRPRGAIECEVPPGTEPSPYRAVALGPAGPRPCRQSALPPSTQRGPCPPRHSRFWKLLQKLRSHLGTTRTKSSPQCLRGTVVLSMACSRAGVLLYGLGAAAQRVPEGGRLRAAINLGTRDPRTWQIEVGGGRRAV